MSQEGVDFVRIRVQPALHHTITSKHNKNRNTFFFHEDDDLISWQTGSTPVHKTYNLRDK